MKNRTSGLAFSALALVLLCSACDASDSNVDVELEDELGEAAQELRTCYFFNPPATPDEAGSIVGSNGYVSAVGYGSYECGLFRLGVEAAPPTDKVQRVTVSSFGVGACSGVTGIARVWTKTLGVWSNTDIPLTFTQNVEWVHGLPVQTCSGSGSKFYGFTGSSTITDVHVGASIGTPTVDHEITLEVQQGP